MSARISNNMGQKYDPSNYLLMHAMGPNVAGTAPLSAVLTGNPLYEVTEGEAWFNGKNILEMKPEDRAHEGLFLSFQ